MKGKPSTGNFRGYARDKFEIFRKQKEEQFHRKYGRFADKSASLANSRETTMIEPGSMFAMDTLYEDCADKLFALTSISKLGLFAVEDIKSLQSKLKLQTMTQNKKDLDSYKDKISFSVNKITEIEHNLLEIKNLQIEDGKRIEHVGTKFLSSSEKEPDNEHEHKAQGPDGSPEQVQESIKRYTFELRIRLFRERRNPYILTPGI